MRELIIDQLKGSGWLDDNWLEVPGHVRANTPYANWLHNLDDSDLLDAYRRVTLAGNDLD